MPGDNCPCEYVVELRERMDRFELNERTTNATMVAIQKDVEYIKAAISKKNDFGTKIALAVIGGVITILLTYIAAKLGLS